MKKLSLKDFFRQKVTGYHLEGRLVAQRSGEAVEFTQPRGDGGLGQGGGSGLERNDGFEKHPADPMAWTGEGLICEVVTAREASRFPGS